MSYEIRVVRFELYPRDEPTCYCVGFEGKTVSGRQHYVDTQVPLADAKGLDEEAIAALAWENVKEAFTAQMEALAAKASILGTVFIPDK
jgi:hypothetical protein